MNSLSIPHNITGIDYNLINEYNKIYTIYDKIKIHPNSITINDKSINDIIRLEPPYTISCSFLNIDKCQKKSAFFQIKDSNYFCWYHMHCK